MKPEDAYDYSAIGCVEVAVPGKWGYRVTGMSFLNFPRALLVAMNDGVDVTSGERRVRGPRPFPGHGGFRAADARVGRRRPRVHAGRR